MRWSEWDGIVDGVAWIKIKFGQMSWKRWDEMGDMEQESVDYIEIYELKEIKWKGRERILWNRIQAKIWKLVSIWFNEIFKKKKKCCQQIE